MSETRADRLMELLEIVMNFLAALCVQTALFAAFRPLGEAVGKRELFVRPSLWQEAWLAAAPVGFWLVRIYGRKFFLFTALHGAVWAAVILIPGRTPPQRMVFGLLAGVYLLNSFYARFSRQEEREGALGPVAAALAAAGSFLACSAAGVEEGCARILKLALVYVFCFFLSTYLENLSQFVRSNRSSNAHIPVERMLAQGGGLTAVCSLCVVALLGVGTNQTLMESLTRAVKGVGMWLARAFFMAAGWLLSLFGGGEQERQEEAGPASPPAWGAAEMVEQPAWLELLLQLVELVILTAAAALVCWMLYRLVLAAVHRFYEGTERKEEAAGQAVEIREKLKPQRGRKRRGFLSGLRPETEDERIRKLFVKTVWASPRYRYPEGAGAGRRGKNLWLADARNELTAGKTAPELAETLTEGEEEERKEAFRRLSVLYGQARYRGGCGAQETKAAAQARAEIRNRRRKG